MKEVELKSGSKLSITMADFATAKGLFQAFAEEVGALNVSTEDQLLVIAKNMLCSGLSSKKIEASLDKCMEKVAYNGVRLTKGNAVFEDPVSREDYLEVCYEVAMENLLPFTKNLSALFLKISEKIQGTQA